MEMTGGNRVWNATSHYGQSQRQRLGNGKPADGNLFLHLTAHANGRPVYGHVYQLLPGVVLAEDYRVTCSPERKRDATAARMDEGDAG